MKKISLSDVEVNDLLDLYQSEIDRAQRRINNLKTIVKKISEGKSTEPSEEKTVKVESKRGRKSKVKVAETKVEKIITTEPKKRGRKPKAKVEVVKAEPKKRGPKPKVKIAKPKVKVEVKAEIKKEQKVKVAKVKAEPKKRGPKPKVKIAEPKAKAVVKAKVEAKKVDKKIVTKAEPKKRGRKPKVVAANAVVAEEKKEVKVAEKAKKLKPKAAKKKVAKVKVEPKKRGRKPKSLRKPIKGGKGKDKVKWNVFINETITSKNSLMLASSLTHAALEKFEIPASDRDRVRMAISTTLTKMANKDKVLHTYTQAGIRGAFFGLAKWFNDKGELNNDYKKKLM